LQHRQSKFVQVKHEVTTVESRAFTLTEHITLDYSSGQLSLLIALQPHWLAALMKALRE